MSYFSLIRSTDYSFRTNDPNNFLSFDRVKDITQRFKLVEYVRSSKLRGSEYYFIQDGERPDTVSYKLYGKADLHWLIFLFNGILNPLFEWPMSYLEIRRIIEEKYKGTSIFLNIFGLSYFDETEETNACRDGKTLFQYEDYIFSTKNEVILKKNGGNEIRGKFIDFDVKTGELRVLFEGNLESFNPESNRIESTEYSELNLITEDLLGRQKTISIKESVFKIFKKSQFVFDHFENEDGMLFSPLFYYEDVFKFTSELQNIATMEFLISVENGIPPLYKKCFADTLLGKYLIEDNEMFVVTRERQEFVQNETRRKIEFPDPVYVPEMIKEIRKIISE
jgi:hypothetical protein